MSLTLGSNCDSGAMYWIRSWPWPAWISAAMRAGIWVLSMWSTVTLTPTFLPQSLANGSNHLSWLGTKWLQSRIRRSPDSLLRGSTKVVLGAGSDGAAGVPAGFLPLQAASVPPTATSPEESRKVRRGRLRGAAPARSPPRED